MGPWRVAHWGTKWNACHAQIENVNGAVEIAFATAWSALHPVFRKLAEMFPELSFEFSWSDEDEPDVTHSLKINRGEAEAV